MPTSSICKVDPGLHCLHLFLEGREKLNLATLLVVWRNHNNRMQTWDFFAVEGTPESYSFRQAHKTLSVFMCMHIPANGWPDSSCPTILSKGQCRYRVMRPQHQCKR